MRRLLILTTLVSGVLLAPSAAFATTAPTISAPVSPFATTSNSIGLSWNDVSALPLELVTYRVLRATASGTTCPATPPLGAANVSGDMVNTFAYADSLAAEGFYCYWVEADDGLTGVADSGPASVTYDKTAPQISIASVNANGCTGPYTVTPTVTDNLRPFTLTVDGLPATSGVAYSPPGLPPAPPFTLVSTVITATDGLTPATMTVSGTTYDSSGPGTASLEISTDPAQQQATLNWDPVIYDGAPIHYSLRTQGPQGVRVSTVVPPVVVQNLLVDASYAFTLAAVDACNRSGAASTKTVRLNDTTPPSAPIVAKPGFDPATHVVALTWIASSDNIQVDHYEILRNGVPIGATDSTSFADAFPPQASVLSYVVRAVDTNGNETEAAPATVTTPDWTPPTGPLLSQPTRVGTAVTLRWPPAADNIGVVGYDILRGESATGPQKLIASLPGTGRTYVDRNVPLGRHYWWVRARDAAGLSTPSAGQTLVVSKALLGATVVSMHSTRKGKGSERYSLGGPVRMIMDIRIVGTVTKGKLRLYVKSGRGRITVWRGTPGSSAPRVQLGSSLVRRGYVTIKLGRALHEGRIRLVLIASKRVVIAPTGAHKPKLKTA